MKTKLTKDLKLREDKILLEGTEIDLRYYTEVYIKELTEGGYIFKKEEKKKKVKTKKVQEDGGDNSSE
jgi:hypothetical protein|tara:strand:+ start:172 stop:375 length:204 start_codon:yes stop_codon:yes gene_type:complete